MGDMLSCGIEEQINEEMDVVIYDLGHNIGPNKLEISEL